MIVNKYLFKSNPNQMITNFNNIHQKIQKQVSIVNIFLLENIKLKNIQMKTIWILLRGVIWKMMLLCLWIIRLSIIRMKLIFNSRLLDSFPTIFLDLMLKFERFKKIVMNSHHQKSGNHQFLFRLKYLVWTSW